MLKGVLKKVFSQIALQKKLIAAIYLLAVSSSALAHSGHHDSDLMIWFKHALTHNDHLFAWFGITALLMTSVIVWRVLRHRKNIAGIPVSVKVTGK